MDEIRIHGRGGQGGVIASKILAVGMFIEGKEVQAFPKFGVERRGAPIEAFLRVDMKKIMIRSEIENPNYLMVLDETLLQVLDVTVGLAENGWLLINSTKPPEYFSKLISYRIATVDASGIAVKYELGTKSTPIVNTAICGAFSKCSKMVEINSVCQAIREEVTVKTENNIGAAREAFETTLMLE
ncbi:MAG: 2-oxoacid:acceptor oxidoreductase family protein [SAR324 cluster bacterium]|nr:2-oxoacid:acceptor oxidoreductase family protein [SAR324 cluster bacterium]MBL7036055.1 2-oxoacid:acceptor oxidoreductase family protein [SAR324 cluster bacterium]